MNSGRSDYLGLINPALEFLASSKDYIELDNLTEAVVEALELSAREREEMLPSGRQTVFETRLQWALSYLEQDMLIESDGSGAFRITNSGRRFLTSPQKRVEKGFSEGAAFFQPGDDQPPSVQTQTPSVEQNLNSEEVIAMEFERLYQALKSTIIDKIHAQEPEFFENLIIDLLLAMGYGDRRRDLSLHLGRTGDGGVDGAINQDQLGLDVVYIQAKRYKPGLAVPISAVRDFAGALEAHKANKGVFVTTSHFTRGAREFVSAVSRRIVLIDGGRLASLLLRNNIGVKLHETWEIKRLDEDYFA